MKPASSSLWLAGALCMVALLAGFMPLWSWLWTLSALLLVMAWLVDFLRAVVPPNLSFERVVAHNLPVNVWAQVSLTINNRSGRHLHCRVFDHHPALFVSRDLPTSIELDAQQSARIVYHVRPQQRGDAEFSQVEMIIASPFGLWLRKARFPLSSRAKVFPDFSEVSHYMLLATDNHLSQLGIKLKLRRGDGNDFLQLREYREGDSMRQIDWKSSARLRKIISREYQDERDQQLVFMLDCGRRMRHQSGHLSHLDQTLNSMLLLSYVASSQGDAVGFMAFAGEDRWFAPQKGQQTVNRILNNIYDIHSSTESADYLLAARRLLSRQRKRSMVVILTNTRDEDAEDLRQAIELLSTRHRVVLADLREQVLDEVIEQEVRTHAQALDFLSVNDYRARRRKAHRRLRSQGGYVLDVTAQQLPVAMVNEYFRLKRSAG
jgi:uncharacterized protein (DUF58 family)